MRLIVIVALIAAAVWYGYSHHLGRMRASDDSTQQPVADLETSQTSLFSCDGRTRCSQMTSCAEATYFLRNCPNTQMDGDHDGIPCERQWCN